MNPGDHDERVRAYIRGVDFSSPGSALASVFAMFDAARCVFHVVEHNSPQPLADFTSRCRSLLVAAIDEMMKTGIPPPVDRETSQNWPR